MASAPGLSPCESNDRSNDLSWLLLCGDASESWLEFTCVLPSSSSSLSPSSPSSPSFTGMVEANCGTGGRGERPDAGLAEEADAIAPLAPLVPLKFTLNSLFAGPHTPRATPLPLDAPPSTATSTSSAGL